MIDLLPIAIYMIIGFCATLAGGFWGLGGGLFIVPSLMICGLSPQTAVAASLLQMIPSTFLTVVKQFPHIGWSRNSWGIKVALPLCGMTFVGGFFGRPLGTFIYSYFGSYAAQQICYLTLLAIVFFRTLKKRKKGGQNSITAPAELNLNVPVIAVAGFITGTISSFLGIGGGTITRPVMASCLNMPEKAVGQIARLNVFIIGTAGTISYLSEAGFNLEKSMSTQHIIPVALALSIAGVFGFSFGAKIHTTVLDAGRDKKAQKGFTVIILMMFICVSLKLFHFTITSQILVIISGLFICVYLAYLNKTSKRILGYRNENQSN